MRGPLWTVLTSAAVISALALAWIAAEVHQRTCVETAAARYPAVAVSAFTGNQTGPLKVAYDRQRAASVDGCGRLPW